MAAHGLDAVRQLGGVGLQELAPRRRAKNSSRTSTVVPVARAAGASSPRARHRAGSHVRRSAVRLVIDSSATDAIAASASPRKPIVATALQLGERCDLAGRVALQRQRQLGGRDADAVVLDHDAAHAAGREPHDDLARAGVERVVDQLAHHRGRPLDHLAGGDLADQFVGQLADRAPAARGLGQEGLEARHSSSRFYGSPRYGLADARSDPGDHSRGASPVLLVGGGALGGRVLQRLAGAGVPLTLLRPQAAGALDALPAGVSQLIGDVADPKSLEAAGVRQARLMVLADGTLAEKMHVCGSARELNPRLAIVGAASHDAEAAWLRDFGVDEVCDALDQQAEQVTRAVRARL